MKEEAAAEAEELRGNKDGKGKDKEAEEPEE